MGKYLRRVLLSRRESKGEEKDIAFGRKLFKAGATH
jgi:hypothetical protein